MIDTARHDNRVLMGCNNQQRIAPMTDVRDFFRQEQESRVKKTDKTRITMPAQEGYKDVRLILPKGKKPFVTKYQHFINGKTITTCNTRDSRGFSVGLDAIVKSAQKDWGRYKAAKQQGDKDMMDVHYRKANAKTPKARHLWYAVDVEHPEEGVKVLTATDKLHAIMVDAIAGNPKQGEPGLGGDVFDMDKGRNLRLIKSKGPGGFFVFDRTKFMEPSRFGTPEERTVWATTFPDLDAIDPPATPEELQAELEEYNCGLGDNDSPSKSSTSGDKVLSDEELDEELQSIVNG